MSPSFRSALWEFPCLPLRVFPSLPVALRLSRPVLRDFPVIAPAPRAFPSLQPLSYLQLRPPRWPPNHEACTLAVSVALTRGGADASAAHNSSCLDLHRPGHRYSCRGFGGILVGLVVALQSLRGSARHWAVSLMCCFVSCITVPVVQV